MKIALGVFDGVHLGHQKVIEKAHRVLTFHPHPNKGVHLLTTLAERKSLINNLEVVKFNEKLGKLSPEEFIRDFLVKKYKPQEIIVGHDYAFGYNRSGNVKSLKDFGKKYNFEVLEVGEIKYKGRPIRSSWIRQLLGKGKIEEAALLLGRNYSLGGKVVRGCGIGRALGFPTANVKVDENKLVPKSGVYQGEVIVGNKLFPCAISIGEQKTFNGHKVEVEVHIINFCGNIYHQRIKIFFNKFIRLQQKFANKEQLKNQIKKDVKLIFNI